MQKRGGFLQIGEDEVSLFWPLGRPWKRERKRGINVEVCGSCWNLEKVGILENWKILWLVEEGRDLKKKEKGKEIKREDIFLDKKMKMLKKTNFRV